MILYDMGAGSTVAAIVGFQIVKTKEKGFSETHPQAQILGVGYDRSLGGSEITFRMREYLADQFNGMKKTKTDVRSVPRAMGTDLTSVFVFFIPLNWSARYSLILKVISDPPRLLSYPTPSIW